MFRLPAVIALILLSGCADPSKGAALNECRLRYWLHDPAAQAVSIPQCMQAKSFQVVAPCTPEADPYQWDWQVRAFGYDDPRCYRPVGSTAWITTALSPM